MTMATGGNYCQLFWYTYQEVNHICCIHSVHLLQNTQGGYSGGTGKPATLIGIRPGSGKFVVAINSCISKAIALSLVAEQISCLQCCIIGGYSNVAIVFFPSVFHNTIPLKGL